MSSLLPSGPRERAYLAHPQPLGVLPTAAFWSDSGLPATFIGFALAVGHIAGRGRLPWMVGPLLGCLVGTLLLGLLERAVRRHARVEPRFEAVGPEACRSEVSSETDRPGPSSSE